MFGKFLFVSHGNEHEKRHRSLEIFYKGLNAEQKSALDKFVEIVEYGVAEIGRDDSAEAQKRLKMFETQIRSRLVANGLLAHYQAKEFYQEAKLLSLAHVDSRHYRARQEEIRKSCQDLGVPQWVAWTLSRGLKQDDHERELD
jgi:hypothetical protein